MMGWNGGYGMFLGPLFMILVLAATVAIIVLAVRWLIGAQQGPTLGTWAPPTQTPIDILKERFARGEIDKDEFEERRRVLEGRSSSA
jgi:putative membrane protein